MLRSDLKSQYCLKTAPKAFDDLISNANCRYILVSYNNRAGKGNQRSNARIKDEEIIRSLSKRGKTEIFETEFKSFTTGKSKIQGHTERVFFCEVSKGKNLMAHVQWCIGNTTLREAARLKDGKGANTAVANKLTLYPGFTIRFFVLSS